ncbi:hypothetical protein ACVJGD_005253 [Bradyrhizobium sp. USDA 10063]
MAIASFAAAQQLRRFGREADIDFGWIAQAA